MDFRINGRAVSVDVDLRTSLLDLLRDHLGLTGAKKGCNQGACDACTVLVDGERINACLALAVQYQGRDIVTVEGLSDGDGRMHPQQAAFVEHDCFQCGYCTPGPAGPPRWRRRGRRGSPRRPRGPSDEGGDARRRSPQRSCQRCVGPASAQCSAGQRTGE